MPAGDIIRRDGVIYRDNGDGTATVVGYEDQSQEQGRVIADPTAGTRSLADEAQLNRALADVTRVETQNEMDRRAAAQQDERRARGTLQSGMATGNVLDAIRNARRIAMQGGTGAESLLAALPATNARALQTELDTVIANLSFDRLQQMRDQSETGGALGSITENELSLLGSTVGSLDPAVDLTTFLRRLDKVERHFMGAQMAMNGIDPRSPEGQQAYRDFGYSGVFEGENQQRDSLADPGANQTRDEYPQELQNLHLRYLRDNWGNIDPGDYARFRMELDLSAGFEPVLGDINSVVQQWNDFANRGGSPEQLGGIAREARDIGTVEGALNTAAQSAPGAFAANWANAATAGLPTALAGGQEEMNLLREARPNASMAGELVGGAIGSYGLGRLAPMLGVNPLAADVGFNAAYGATQDSNPLRGAFFGAGGAAAGSLAGGALGGLSPNFYARGAMNDAASQVPSVLELKDLAGQQYRDVEARGIAATGQDTTDLAGAFDRMLQREGRISPQGNLIDTDTPVTRARQLVQDYAGEPMTPTQAQRVRSVIAEGAASPDPAQRRLGSMLTREFDQWADPVLPGIDVPRATSQRYIQGQQLGNVIDTARAVGQSQKGNDIGDAMRTAFRQLDRGVLAGTENFAPEVVDQIARTSRGDRLTNALRFAGKFGAQNPLTMAGTAGPVGAIGYALGGLPGGVAAGVGTTALGSAARSASSNRTLQAAEVARLMALGGDQYRASLDAAIAEARRNAGSIYGGLFGTGASIKTRQ